MHPDAFDFVLFAVVAVLLLAMMRIAYELGRDDGWKEAGRWADDNLGELTFRTLDGEVAAARHDRESVAERTFPYRGEIE